MRVLISAGDYSADIHGESLVRRMRALDPDLKVTALGGVRLKSVADAFLRDMVELDVSGFTRPVRQFFVLRNILVREVVPLLEARRVDRVVLIDYYGFNIHVARKARERGIPVYYFVSPQVWASRRGRIRKLKEAVTKMLVIFPFEEQIYRSQEVPVEFVGHPLMDRLGPARGPVRPEAIRSGDVHLGLMPGSRPRELVRHLPLMLETFRLLQKRWPRLRATLFAVDNIADESYASARAVPGVRIVREKDFEARSSVDLCLTASGTATLENALLGIPMIVVYQTSWLTYWIARLIIQVPFISMPNLLAGREVSPELIQRQAAPRRLADRCAGFLEDPDRLERQRLDLAQLRSQLGPPGAYDRAARAVLGQPSPQPVVGHVL